MRIPSLSLALSRVATSTIANGFLLLVIGLAVILSLSVFTMLPQSSVVLLPNQHSAFATFPGENGLIAFSATTDGTTPGGIYVINSDGAGQRRINAEKGYGSGSILPAWSPDGSRIAFTRYDGSTVSNIDVMNYDGSNQIALTNYPIDSHVFNFMGSWSPDGSKIAFTRTGDQSDIYVMNAANGGQVQRLTTNTAEDQYPDWSPDGSKIVFSSNRDGNFEIYIMNPDGSRQTRLTNTDEHENLPSSWSPDSSKIAFQSSGNGIFVMNSDGTGRSQLTETEDWNPVWSPEGDKIALVRNTGSVSATEIYVINADDGSNQVRLTGENLINENGPDWGTQTTLPPLPPATICKGQAATIVGTAGSDDLVGTSNRDVIAALGGNDRISGLGGNDLICGGNGSDTMAGGAGNDMMAGGSGNDQMSGGSGNDQLLGEGGNDNIAGGDGTDSANGGAGASDMCTAETETNCEA